MLVFDEVKNENTYSNSTMLLLRMVGVLKFDPFIVEDGEALLYGASEIFELAKRLDKRAFVKLNTWIELNTSNRTAFIFQVYMKTYPTGGMCLPTSVFERFDGFYNINEHYYVGQLENLWEIYGEELDNLLVDKNKSVFEMPRRVKPLTLLG